MKKFLVMSGFLGTGKTTTMMTLVDRFNEKYGKAAMISNDLGAKGLVDFRYSSACGCPSTELTGGCICYQTENLVDKLRRLFDYDHNDFVISDIPGFGVGAPEHVYHKLADDYRGEFSLAPFTTMTEAKTVQTLLDKEMTDLVPHDLKYILQSQLLESDLIVLNKIDLLSAEKKEACMNALKKCFPDIPVMAVSAKTGEGIDELIQYLVEYDATMKHTDIGYGGEKFMKAMGHMTEYNIQYYSSVCCNTFNPDAYLSDLSVCIANEFSNEKCEIPHLKIYAEDEGGRFAKADLQSVGNAPVFSRIIGKQVKHLPVVINASVVADSKKTKKMMSDAIQKVSSQYNLSNIVFYEECFGAIDPGRT